MSALRHPNSQGWASSFVVLPTKKDSSTSPPRIVGLRQTFWVFLPVARKGCCGDQKIFDSAMLPPIRSSFIRIGRFILFYLNFVCSVGCECLNKSNERVLVAYRIA